MHLPTPQFSRLVTILAFDLTNPALDSMIMAWDHIATRYLNRISSDRAASGKVESVRLLAIHDAVHAVFGSSGGYIYDGFSKGNSLAAALAATAQASHDVLASAFGASEDLADLDDALEESLSLISDDREKAAGAITGAESATTYLRNFGPLGSEENVAGISEHHRLVSHEDGRQVHRLAKNHWRFEWQRSA
jgi:hypothetical protein